MDRGAAGGCAKATLCAPINLRRQTGSLEARRQGQRANSRLWFDRAAESASCPQATWRATQCPVSFFLGMTVEMLIQTYGHHHPDFQADAAEAIVSKARSRNLEECVPNAYGTEGIGHG